MSRRRLTLKEINTGSESWAELGDDGVVRFGGNWGLRWDPETFQVMDWETGERRRPADGERYLLSLARSFRSGYLKATLDPPEVAADPKD